MANWVRVGTSSEIPEGQCRVYETSGNSIAVFNVGGAYHAIDSTCLHQGGPLGEGEIQGNIVTCPWHHWSYDVTTGRTTMSESVGVKKYPLEVRDGELFVDVA